MENINYWAVVSAAFSAFALGGLWYDPRVFGTIWQRESGITDEDFKGGHGALVFGVAFIMSLIAAYALAMFLSLTSMFEKAFCVSSLIGICFVATSFGINFSFSKKSLKLYFVDAGYHVVQFALYGLILQMWR